MLSPNAKENIIETLKKIQKDYKKDCKTVDGIYVRFTHEWNVLALAIQELKKKTITKEIIEKITDEIIDNSFSSDIFNDKTNVEIIKLDTVLDIIKRNLEGE